MSSPREAWWPYAKNVIRRYPYLLDKIRSLKVSQTTAHYGQSGGGGGDPGRDVEMIALRELPEKEQKYLEAVDRAIRTTSRQRSGAIRMQLIDLVYFRKSHTIYGASIKLHISEQTAKRWHGDFVRLVAQYLGLS